MTFDQAVEIIFKHEGGYVNNPKDPGGETNFGISKRSFPHVDIKNLTRDKAKAIYLEEFWEPARIGSLPAPIRLMVFDCAVNQGAGFAIGTLQAIVGARIDGICGPVTLGLINSADLETLAYRYLMRRHDRYLSNRNWPIFGWIWSKRLADISFRTGVQLCKSS